MKLGVKTWDCPDDATVLVKVGHFLKEHPEYPAIKVWQSKHSVASLGHRRRLVDSVNIAELQVAPRRPGSQGAAVELAGPAFLGSG